MTTISAKIIADSISPSGKRLTTMQLRYPRFIHSEFMTHRVFSRNASSSRAIPVKTMLENIGDDPAMPVKWGKNKPGMQDDGSLNEIEEEHVMGIWASACQHAIHSAERMLRMPEPPHKQVINRLLEPFMHIDVIVTSTEWDNFFGLRCHEDADPTIQKLAETMLTSYNKSVPKEIAHGDWHLPYIDDDTVADIVMHVLADHDDYIDDDLLRFEATEVAIKCSTSRCARVSYLTHDGKKPTIEADLKLFEKLCGAQPMHASPAEHQSTPDLYLCDDVVQGYHKSHLHGNLQGWIQHRKLMPDEYIHDSGLIQLRAGINL